MSFPHSKSYRLQKICYLKVIPDNFWDPHSAEYCVSNYLACTPLLTGQHISKVQEIVSKLFKLLLRTFERLNMFLLCSLNRHCWWSYVLNSVWFWSWDLSSSISNLNEGFKMSSCNELFLSPCSCSEDNFQLPMSAQWRPGIGSCLQAAALIGWEQRHHSFASHPWSS